MNRWPNLICHPCLPPLRAVMRLVNLAGRVTAEQRSVAGSTQEVQRSPSRHSGWDTAARGWQLPVPAEVTHTEPLYLIHISIRITHTLSHTQDKKSHKLWCLALSQKTVKFVPDNIRIYFYHFITAELLRNHIYHLRPMAVTAIDHYRGFVHHRLINYLIYSKQIYFMQHIYS